MSRYSWDVLRPPRRRRIGTRTRGTARAAVVWSCLVSCLAGWTLGSGGARADEDDWQVAGRAGLAGVVADGRSPLGLGVGGDLQYGLDDAWSLHLSLSGAGQRVDADTSHMLPGGTVWSYAAFAGLGYTMDVLRLLPTFEAGLGVLGMGGAVTSSRLAVGVQVGMGADYLLTPRFSLGLELRNHNEIEKEDGEMEWMNSALFLGPVAAYSTKACTITFTVLPQLPALKTEDNTTFEVHDHEKLEARLHLSLHF